MTTAMIPDFIRSIHQELRSRHQFALGTDDLIALKVSLSHGFGLATLDDLRDLCCLLWAKSREERRTLVVVFNRVVQHHGITSWPEPFARDDSEDTPEPEKLLPGPQPPLSAPIPIRVRTNGGIPSPPMLNVQRSYGYLLTPQPHPTYRETAQVWRRLRWSVREGPPEELDVEATIVRRCRLGVASDAVLRPRRRNTTARLLLLVDRDGSMAPFHGFVALMCDAILHTRDLRRAAVYYFHDVPSEDTTQAHRLLPDELFPKLDNVLHQIQASADGLVFSEAKLTVSVDPGEVLESLGPSSFVVIISDAGAARRHYDPVRLVNTVAFMKAVRDRTTRYVWLNPWPEQRWKPSTAAEIARHVPMFPITKAGMHHAVNALLGRLHSIEKPL